MTVLYIMTPLNNRKWSQAELIVVEMEAGHSLCESIIYQNTLYPVNCNDVSYILIYILWDLVPLNCSAAV